jgi:hypothetical protein
MRIRIFFVLAAACLVGVPAASAAQKPGTNAPTKPEDPCCTITTVDSATSIVTARETASGYTFKFKVTDRKLLLSLKLGEKIWADFSKKTVRLRKSDATPCCAIIPPPPGLPEPAASIRGE